MTENEHEDKLSTVGDGYPMVKEYMCFELIFESQNEQKIKLVELRLMKWNDCIYEASAIFLATSGQFQQSFFSPTKY